MPPQLRVQRTGHGSSFQRAAELAIPATWLVSPVGMETGPLLGAASTRLATVGGRSRCACPGGPATASCHGRGSHDCPYACIESAARG